MPHGLERSLAGAGGGTRGLQPTAHHHNHPTAGASAPVRRSKRSPSRVTGRASADPAVPQVQHLQGGREGTQGIVHRSLAGSYPTTSRPTKRTRVVSSSPTEPRWPEKSVSPTKAHQDPGGETTQRRFPRDQAS